MDEILFRGKTRNGEWKESSSVFIRGELAIMLNERPIKELIKDKNGELIDVIFSFCAVEKNTVGRFTGLIFKGVKAFEGDIVKGLFLHGRAILGVISFQDGAFGLAWKRGNIDEFSPFPCMCNVNYEIVGNIHDNPELLEVE